MVLNFIISAGGAGRSGQSRWWRSLASLTSENATARISGGGSDMAGGAINANINSVYRGARGLDPEILAQITKMYGFDKPPLERFEQMMGNYLRFDFGESFFRNESVIHLGDAHTLPVDDYRWALWTTLGVWSISSRYRLASARPCATAPASISGPAGSSSSAMPYRASCLPSYLSSSSLAAITCTGFPLKGLVSDDWKRHGLYCSIRQSSIISGISRCRSWR